MHQEQKVCKNNNKKLLKSKTFISYLIFHKMLTRLEPETQHLNSHLARITSLIRNHVTGTPWRRPPGREILIRVTVRDNNLNCVRIIQIGSFEKLDCVRGKAAFFETFFQFFVFLFFVFFEMFENFEPSEVAVFGLKRAAEGVRELGLRTVLQTPEKL